MDERPKCKTGSHQNPRGKRGKNLFGFGDSNILLDMSPEARETKTKMNYWDLIKIKSFCTVKETISKTKRQLTKREKIYISYTHTHTHTHARTHTHNGVLLGNQKE